MANARVPWAIREFGDLGAPPVVLLHSIATNGTMWLPQVGPWAARFRIVAVDLPGHGLTPSDDRLTSLDDYADRLLEVLTDRAIVSPCIVGLSLGGMIVQSCAVRHPDRVRAAVIANSLSHVASAAGAIWDERSRRAQEQGMNSQTADTLARWFTPTFLKQNVVTMRWIQSMIESTSVDGYRIAIGAIKKLDYLERLCKVNCPALVVTGAQDPVATPAAAHAMVERIASAESQVLESAAHLSNVEQPVRFTELVGAFLDEVIGGRASIDPQGRPLRVSTAIREAGAGTP